jgi:hypothetical protein
MSIPGMSPMSVFPGEGVGVGDCGGIGMPFMFMPCMSCFFGARLGLFFRRAPGPAFDLAFEPAFRLDFGLTFGFRMFMPGMFCMSCP